MRIRNFLDEKYLVYGLFLIMGIIITTMISTYHILIPIAVGLAFVIFVTTNFKVMIGFVILSSTFNGMNIENPLLRLENSSILLSVMAMMLFIFGKRRNLFVSREILLFVIFMVYTYFISSGNSPVFEQSKNGMIQLSIAFIGFVVMLQTQHFDKLFRVKLIKYYALVSVLQTLYGIVSFAIYRLTGVDLGGLMFGQGGNSITLKGSFLEANLYGAFVGVGLIMSIMLIVNKMVKHVMLWHLASIILFFGLILSWTRSAWIGFVVAITVLAIYNFRKFFNMKTVVLFIIVFGLIIGPLFILIQKQFDSASGDTGLLVSKLTNLFESDGGTGLYRLTQFNNALIDVKGHEILGKGYFSIKAYGEKEWISNMYLFIYHDAGLIGCLLFFPIILSVLIKGIRGLRRTDDRETKTLLAALLSGLLLYLITFNFTPGHTLSIFWIHLGLILAIVNNIKTVKYDTSIQ